MPTYEYRRETCSPRVSTWVRRMGSQSCPRCASVVGDVSEHDPRNVARLVKSTGQEAGGDFEQGIAEMQRGAVRDSLEAEPQS